MKNVSNFITELESLKSDVGKGKYTVPEKIILEQKLEDFQEKEKQLEADIQREVDDLFAYIDLKQANIESFNMIKEYVESEIKKLEQALSELNISK